MLTSDLRDTLEVHGHPYGVFFNGKVTVATADRKIHQFMLLSDDGKGGLSGGPVYQREKDRNKYKLSGLVSGGKGNIVNCMRIAKDEMDWMRMAVGGEWQYMMDPNNVHWQMA